MAKRHLRHATRLTGQKRTGVGAGRRSVRQNRQAKKPTLNGAIRKGGRCKEVMMPGLGMDGVFGF
jgi:hypothetical protein